MSKVPGYRVITGNEGRLWWDGLLVAEVISIDAKVVAQREDVQFAGDINVDSKITGLKGEGSFVLKKVFSRGQKAMLAAWKAGKDTRSMLKVQLAGGDIKDGARESATLSNVWFNELTIAQFDSGKPLERTYPFGFNPGSVIINDEIPVTEG